MIRPFTMLAAIALYASSASAGTLFTAELDNAQTETGKYIAAKALWKCDGSACYAELAKPRVTIKKCREIAGQVGALKAFRSETHYLTSSQLAKCNKAARISSPKIVASR